MTPEDHHQDSTPNCCHEQLLVGWKQGAVRMGTMRRHTPSRCKHEQGGFFVLFLVTTGPSLTPNM